MPTNHAKQTPISRAIEFTERLLTALVRSVLDPLETHYDRLALAGADLDVGAAAAELVVYERDSMRAGAHFHAHERRRPDRAPV